MSPAALRAIPELPGLDPVIKTAHRTMRCSSLRPGHWLVPGSDADSIPVCVILQNSSKLRHVEIYQPLTRSSESWAWTELQNALCYGQGEPRRWHAFLPKFLQSKISPFTAPKK